MQRTNSDIDNLKANSDLENLKLDIQQWMEQHGLQTDTKWRQIVSPKASHTPHLAIPMGGDLARIISPAPDDHSEEWHLERFQEFAAIVEKHGFAFQFLRGAELCIVPAKLQAKAHAAR